MRTCFALALCLSLANGCRDNRLNLKRTTGTTGTTGENPINNDQTVMPQHKHFAPLVAVSVNRLTVHVNTSAPVTPEVSAAPVTASTVSSTVLVIARDATTAYSAYSGLNDYGIPYQLLIVPAQGVALPRLNETSTQGNFGLIVVQSEVSYLNSNTNTYGSALTDAQWSSIYSYQTSFGVRLVRLDVAPGPSTGTVSLGGCCNTSEQLVSISSDAGFTTAGLKTGATLSTVGLYHYPAKITDSSIATEFAQFDVATAEGFNSKSTAAVINKINGREQMVFFIGSSTDWSLTSNYLQHAWVHWGTRGIYTGFRRAMLTPQVDDIFLLTPMYDHNTTEFRVRGADLDNHVAWIPKITKKLNAGSTWFMEIGHNGNGNIEQTDNSQNDQSLCAPGPIEYPDQIDTPLEFAKPLGTGTDLWPTKMVTYAKDGKYSSDCIESDELQQWFMDADNLNAFAHISHTFTHMDQNNATYADCLREITWNTAWLKSAGISKAKRYTVDGIIPPAITGLHNGDALRAWVNAGLKHVVGDNTRPILLNQINEHWPVYTTNETNGYEGIQIIPRWASNIYYNCDLPACTVLEWQTFSSGKGDFNDLLTLEKNANVRHLLSLRKDPYMFHQANMRVDDVADITINGSKGQYSLLMAWVETIVTEYVRLVKWPVVSQKQDDLAATFNSRMARDACKPILSWTIDNTQNIITGVTVSAQNVNCKEKLPVTFPGTVKDVQGATKEQLGSDPLTLWVTLAGKPVSFTLTAPIQLAVK